MVLTICFSYGQVCYVTVQQFGDWCIVGHTLSSLVNPFSTSYVIRQYSL